MFKKFIKPEFILYSLIIPMAGLVFYCAVFGFVSDRFLIQGINYIFVNRMVKLLLVLIALSGAALIAIMLATKTSLAQLKFKYSVQKFELKDSILLLLPLIPVIQYVLTNVDTLSVFDALLIIGFFLLFSLIPVVIVPLLLGRPDSARVTMLAGLALVFTLNSMSLLSQAFSWYAKGSLKIQLLVFGGVFLVCYLLYTGKLRGFLYTLVVILVVTNSATILAAGAKTAKASDQLITENGLLQYAAGKEPVNKPDIYLLVYDAYVNNETMSSHGIDNSAQEEYLEENGFVLYPHTYSIGATTIDSMSRVLNASTDFYGNSRRGVSGDGVVQRVLKSDGYETYGLFPTNALFRGIGSSYDVSLPSVTTPTYEEIIPAVLIGEFRFDFNFTQLTHEQYVADKEELFADATGTRFFYMHTDIPAHSQNSGVCLVDEVELYHQRVEQANIEMKEDLEIILAKDPNAIIIVAGDHGPYLTKNCIETGSQYDISEITRQDIQDRYGTFLAIRWPDGSYVNYDDITVLQDLFPAIFAYMYEDPQFLNFKVDSQIRDDYIVSQVSVEDGIIIGGANNGEPLYLSQSGK